MYGECALVCVDDPDAAGHRVAPLVVRGDGAAAARARLLAGRAREPRAPLHHAAAEPDQPPACTCVDQPHSRPYSYDYSALTLLMFGCLVAPVRCISICAVSCKIHSHCSAP